MNTIDDSTLKLCPECGNIMMIQGKESIAEYICIICKYKEDIKNTTLINIESNSSYDIEVMNPRTINEVYSPLNSVLYRKCDKKNCPSHKSEKKVALYRKVIYDNGVIKYFCQECIE